MQADIFHGGAGHPDDDIGALPAKATHLLVRRVGRGAVRGGCGVAGGERDPLGPLVVLPAFRGRHIGSRLARFSFDDLFAMGVDRIHMDARETTVRIVCGMGRAVVGEPGRVLPGHRDPGRIGKTCLPRDLNFRRE